MKAIYLPFIFISLLLCGCKLEDLHEPLESDTCTFEVDFQFSPMGICKAPCEISFTADASDAITYNWDFGDGNTSTLPNPTHTFMTRGEYQVQLTAGDSSCTNTSSRAITISTTTFEKVIEQVDESDLLSVSKVVLANDGGYVLVGNRTKNNRGEFGFWYKTDLTGELEIEKIFGCCISFISQPSDIYDVIAIPGNGYAVCGRMNPFQPGDSRFFVALISDVGGQFWSYMGLENSYGNNVLATSDGGYLISGSSGISPNDKGYLVKLDAAGQEEWSKQINSVDLVESVHQTQDGSLIAFTHIPGTENSRLFFLDDSGNITDTRDLPGTASFFFSLGNIVYSSGKMTMAEDDGYLITSRETDVFLRFTSKLRKFDSDGILEWSHSFGTVSLSEIISHDDGTYSVCGSTRPFDTTQKSNAYLAQLNATGQTNWTEQFGGEESDNGISFLQTDDGGYFIVGIDRSISLTDAIPGDKGIYLIKTNAEGKVE